MRGRSPLVDSSDESEYTGSNVDGGIDSDTDLTDPESCSEDQGERGEGSEHQAYFLAEKIVSREHYLQQLEDFDELEYTKEDYGDSSTRQLDYIEDQWNQYVNVFILFNTIAPQR